MVLRVDEEKGYIDLSKRRVSMEDVQACEDKFNKSKMVHSIMRHTCELTGCDLEELNRTVAWPLYKKYKHAFEAFKVIVQDPDMILDQLTKEVDGQTVPALTPELKEVLVKNIRRRMTPQPLKIRADIELTCFAYDGVYHIKSAMREATKASSEDCQVKICLVASPLYVITTQSLDKELGIATVGKAIDYARASIEGNKGKIEVKEEPRAVSERDDRLLQEKMTALDAAQRQVDGDDDDEDQDETMGDIDIDNAGLHV